MQQQQQQQHMQSHLQNQQQMQQLQMQAGGQSFGAINQVSIGRQKLVEEGKLIRMKLEASKNAPAAVLRQQVYRFTDDQPGGGGQGGGKAGQLDSVPTTVEYVEPHVASQSHSLAHGMSMIQQQQQQHALLQQQLQMQQQYNH